MNIKPILFNTETVKAILAGEKTQTRIVNKKAVDMKAYKVERQSAKKWNFYIQYGGMVDVMYPIESPVSASDILWVQETFGRMPYGFVYRADGDSPEGWSEYDRWQSPTHIPHEAVRIFLRVTDVQPQRLQDITEEQAVMEGFSAGHGEKKDKPEALTAVLAFALQWNKTFSNRSCPPRYNSLRWRNNPWVWAITFERCEKPVGWWEVL